MIDSIDAYNFMTSNNKGIVKMFYLGHNIKVWYHIKNYVHTSVNIVGKEDPASSNE